MVDVGEEDPEGDHVPEIVPGMAHAIERRIKSQQLSPTELEDRSGLTGPGLSPIRKGHRRDYQAKTRIGVARALRWPADWYERILAGEDPEDFPDVDHPPRPKTVEERLSELERQVHDLTRLVLEDD